MACIKTCKRPTATDSEEELFKLQKEFLKSKEKPSVNIVKDCDRKSVKQNVVSSTAPNVKDTTVHVNIPNILQSIKERPTSSARAPSCAFHAVTGFPNVLTLSEEEVIQSSGVKKSLFAQRFESLKLKDSERDEKELPKRDIVDVFKIDPLDLTDKQQADSGTSEDCTSNKWTAGSLISGDGLVSDGGIDKESVEREILKIHQENIAVLSNLTDDEIRLKQKEIKQRLGSDLLQFLEKRKSNKNKTKKETKSTVNSKQNVTDNNRDSNTKWLHMDKIESDKLEWMTDVAMDNSLKQQIFHEVRFSMIGEVIGRSEGKDIPTHMGLHHHGDEAEAAGYTLKELIRLSCSSISQQKAISLKTLAIIIERAKHHEYHGVIEGSTLEVLLESHIPKILRYTLDDSTQTVQMEAIHCLHSLLVSSREESFLNTYFNCYKGLFLPRLTSYMPSKNSNDLNQEDNIMKHDVVEGLVSMKLLPRLRYILEVCDPSVDMVTMILEILVSIARHSPNTADKVLNCPRLCKTIREQYLDFKTPYPKALEVFRALCSSGRHASQSLLSQYDILEPILRYCVIHPSAHLLPARRSHDLYVEAARTWTVLLSYGLTTDTFSDIFPTLLQLLSPSFSLSILTSDYLLQYTAILNLLTVSLQVSAITMETQGTLPHLSLTWAHAECMIRPAINCVQRLLQDIDNFKEMKDFSLDRVQCIAATLHLVASYYEELLAKPGLNRNPVDLLQQVESLSLAIIGRFQQSKLFESSLEMISTCMNALPTPPSPPSSLPSFVSISSLSSAVFKHALSPIETYAHSDTGIVHVAIVAFSDLLRSFVRLGNSFVGIHKGTINTLTQALTSDKYMNMLKTFCNIPSKSMFSLMMPLYSLVYLSLTTLVQYQKEEQLNTGVIYSSAFALARSLPPGIEGHVMYLLSNILFHPMFYRQDSQMGGSLVSKTIPLLSSIRQTFITCISQSMHKKACPVKPNALELDSLLLPCANKPILSSDWPYLPVIQVFKQSLLPGFIIDEACVSAIYNALRFVLLLERYHSNSMGTIPCATRITGLMYVFLCGSDLFLDEVVKALLTELLPHYCSFSIDFLNTPVTGVPSFANLYEMLLDQFCAVSYGDSLFAQYLLLPLQQNGSLTLRRVFWMNHADSVARIITLTPNDVSIPINSFLYPLELDFDLVHQYFRILISESISYQKNALLYVVAVHHCHNFLLNEKAQESQRKRLVNSILRSHNKTRVVKDLLLYSSISAMGMIEHSTSSDLKDFVTLKCGLAMPDWY